MPGWRANPKSFCSCFEVYSVTCNFTSFSVSKEEEQDRGTWRCTIARYWLTCVLCVGALVIWWCGKCCAFAKKCSAICIGTAPCEKECHLCWGIGSNSRSRYASKVINLIWHTSRSIIHLLISLLFLKLLLMLLLSAEMSIPRYVRVNTLKIPRWEGIKSLQEIADSVRNNHLHNCFAPPLFKLYLLC